MVESIDEYRQRLPVTHKRGMRIEGLLFADRHLLAQIQKDQTLEQVANVATLPGLVGRSLAMPDAHQGYGFCIGGVAAADGRDGVVSAGGVGFDINCGVRLLATPLTSGEVRGKLDPLLQELFRSIPCGAGRKGELALQGKDLDAVLTRGSVWAVERGYGVDHDLVRIEEGGCLAGADPGQVSRRARERGHDQLGTLGSGNHFLEVQRVSEVREPEIAETFGLAPDQIVVLLHSGSRGLGHQVCTDHLELMDGGMKRHGISVVDRQLACVPIASREGQAYLGAMAAAANFAFANRQIITHRVREAFLRIFGTDRLPVVYDVCHNIAKRETHVVEGKRREVLVHRKGATRAFPAGHDDLPSELRPVGQPVLIPGSMGTASYVLVGTVRAMEETFGSSCHGAGRAKSRTSAKKETDAETLLRELATRGVLVRGQSRAGLTEEGPAAYKDVDRVVAVMNGSGLARTVAKLLPLAVMKG